MTACKSERQYRLNHGKFEFRCKNELDQSHSFVFLLFPFINLRPRKRPLIGSTIYLLTIGSDLNKSEFHDGIHLRYCYNFSNPPGFFSSEQKFTLHALHCQCVGYKRLRLKRFGNFLQNWWMQSSSGQGFQKFSCPQKYLKNINVWKINDVF